MRNLLRNAQVIAAALLILSIAIALFMFAAYVVGYTVAEATVRAEYVTATCPNHDSVTVAVNEWRLGSPTRTVAVPCESSGNPLRAGY
jgi:hypothetical protein